VREALRALSDEEWLWLDVLVPVGGALSGDTLAGGLSLSMVR
jgi:hypothetical protein